MGLTFSQTTVPVHQEPKTDSKASWMTRVHQASIAEEPVNNSIDRGDEVGMCIKIAAVYNRGASGYGRYQLGWMNNTATKT